MKRLYIIAGEPSGDFLGAGVLRELKKDSKLEINGVGGGLMESAGLKSLFDIKGISVGGLWEVLPHIFKIKKIINDTVDDILKTNPDILFTIDSPGFCLRVAKLIKKKNPKIKLVHLVAPSVWAWRSKRAAKLAKLYDHLLTLFDFEPKYFTKHGLDTTFVGHPAIEMFEESPEIKSDDVLILPGSRTQEIKSLLPIFVESLKNVNAKRFVIPTLPHLEPAIRSLTKDLKIDIVSDETEKINLYKSAKFAIVASGTATLQLALSGCPMIVCYRLSKITYKIVKSLVKVKYISLVNIILNKTVVPELIQDECNSKSIANAVKLLDSLHQIEEFRNLRSRLKPIDSNPSKKIAETILSLFH